MRLAYVSIGDSSDINYWSGTAFYMRHSLEQAGLQILPVDRLKEGWHYLSTGIKKVLYKFVLSREYLRQGDPALNRHFYRQIEKALLSQTYDAIFCVDPLPLSFSRTDNPIVFWADSTLASLVDFNPYHSRLCSETIRDEIKMEQEFLSKCRLVVFSSDWAAKTAFRHYDLDPKKVKIVPFGANLECDRDSSSVRKIIAGKSAHACELLFVGTNWHWKGGETALKTAELLNRRGIKTVLHVVGCEPPSPVPGFVQPHGFISKKTRQGREKLDELYAKAHFLILPTRSEAFGIVFAEASSFGVPSLAPKIGGVPSVIRDGKNGRTFPLKAGPEAYSGYIAGLMKNKNLYEKLCLSSLKEYQQRLNWETSGKKVRDLIHKHCGTKNIMKNV